MCMYLPDSQIGCMGSRAHAVRVLQTRRAELAVLHTAL